MIGMLLGRRRRPRWDVLRVVGAVGALVCLAAPTRGAAPQSDAEKAADAYLRALVGGDAKTAQRLSPAKPENKFGPCPFAKMPRLEKPRVDLHRGAVMFKGPARDSQLPPAGGITLTRLDRVKGNPWRIRTIAFFTEPPAGARIPPHSVTRQDTAQEPAATEAARRYVAAWLKGDYKTMESLHFDWVGRIEPAAVRVRSIELTSTPTDRGEVKIQFCAKIVMAYVLPKTVTGAVYAMREDGEWKVRSNELTW